MPSSANERRIPKSNEVCMMSVWSSFVASIFRCERYRRKMHQIFGHQQQIIIWVFISLDNNSAFRFVDEKFYGKKIVSTMNSPNNQHSTASHVTGDIIANDARDACA